MKVLLSESQRLVVGTFNGKVAEFGLSDLRPCDSTVGDSHSAVFSDTVLAYEFGETMDRVILLASNHFGDFEVSQLSNDCSTVVGSNKEVNSSPIGSFAINPLSKLTFAAGDNDGYLKVWELSGDGHLALRSEKREAHQSQVLKVAWTSASELFTVGFDDSFKVFDVESLVNTYFIYFKDSLATTFDFHSQRRALLTGHVNGTIRLFDDSARNKTSQKVFKSHSCCVPTVKVNQFRPDTFASADYEGRIKIWDLRADLPLYTIEAHGGNKVFDLVWKDEKSLVSGGADGQLVSHSFV